MPFRSGATFLCEDVPEFEFRDGMFYVTFEIGNGAVVRIGMRPHHFLHADQRAAKLASRFEGGTILEFPDH